jgi:hypothetical protein
LDLQFLQQLDKSLPQGNNYLKQRLSLLGVVVSGIA